MIPWMMTLPKRTGKNIYYDISVKNSNVVTNPENHSQQHWSFCISVYSFRIAALCTSFQFYYARRLRYQITIPMTISATGSTITSSVSLIIAID